MQATRLAQSTRMKLKSAMKHAPSEKENVKHTNEQEQEEHRPIDPTQHLIKALHGKIQQQAQELTELNDEFVQVKEAKLAAERRVADLLARSYPRPLKPSNNSSSTTANSAKRRYEKETSLKIDALEKTLEHSESMLANVQKQKMSLESKVDDMKKEVQVQSKRNNDLATDIELLKSQLDYAQRSNYSVPSQSRMKHAASAYAARSSVHFHLEETKRLKSQLEKATGRLETTSKAFKARECELLERMHELEEALINDSAARTDTMSKVSPPHDTHSPSQPPSHAADEALIAENAKLRGEIAAHRHHVSMHAHSLEQLQAEKTTLRSQLGTMTEQINSLTMQLQQSQDEKDRLLIGETGARLRVVEKERNALVDFMQGETVKLMEATSRAESAEKSLRASQQNERQSLERMKQLQHVLEAEHDRRQGAEGRLLTLDQLQASNAAAEQKCLDLQTKLDRSSSEGEELERMNETAMKKIVSLESIIAELRADISVSEDQRREQEQILWTYKSSETRLQETTSELRERVRSLETELSTYQTRVSSLEHNHPQVARLNIQIQEQSAELHSLRSVATCVNALKNDMDTGVVFAPPEYLIHLPLSHGHSSWVNCIAPTLTQICPKLYEKIRSLTSDLYRVESEGQELKAVLGSLQREIESSKNECNNIRRNAEGTIQQVRSRSESEKQALQRDLNRTHGVEHALQTKLTRVETENAAKISMLEDELRTMRACKSSLDSIRASVKAFTIGVNAGSKGGKKSAGIGGLAGYDATTGRPNTVDYDNMSDERICDIVSNVIAAHSTHTKDMRDLKQAALTAKESEATVKEDLKRLGEEVAALRGQSDKLKTKERDIQKELHEASKLAEKQNALNAALETKVDSAL